MSKQHTSVYTPELPVGVSATAPERRALVGVERLSQEEIFAQLPIPDAHVLKSLGVQLEEPAQILRSEDVVAFPTETVYGLGGSALSDLSVSRIYGAKGRPSDNPLIVHISSATQLERIVCHVPPIAKRLVAQFWPGPLTIIFRSASHPCGCHSETAKFPVSTKVSAGLSSVAVRMPSHPIAQALIQQADLPIAAPSANTSGKPSPTLAGHVLDDLQGRIPGVIDGKHFAVEKYNTRVECSEGVESTVIDISHLPHDFDIELTENGDVIMQKMPVAFILRPGSVTKKQLQKVVGHVEYDPTLLLVPGDNVCQNQEPTLGADTSAPTPKAPGMKYIHYAPKAPLFVATTSQALHDFISQRPGKNLGVLCRDDTIRKIVPNDSTSVQDGMLEVHGSLFFGNCGAQEDFVRLAAMLYGCLREYDRVGVDEIVVETFTQEEEQGTAVMNRILKASGGKI